MFMNKLTDFYRFCEQDSTLIHHCGCFLQTVLVVFFLSLSPVSVKAQARPSGYHYDLRVDEPLFDESTGLIEGMEEVVYTQEGTIVITIPSKSRLLVVKDEPSTDGIIQIFQNNQSMVHDEEKTLKISDFVGGRTIALKGTQLAVGVEESSSIAFFLLISEGLLQYQQSLKPVSDPGESVSDPALLLNRPAAMDFGDHETILFVISSGSYEIYVFVRTDLKWQFSTGKDISDSYPVHADSELDESGLGRSSSIVAEKSSQRFYIADHSNNALIIGRYLRPIEQIIIDQVITEFTPGFAEFERPSKIALDEPASELLIPTLIGGRTFILSTPGSSSDQAELKQILSRKPGDYLAADNGAYQIVTGEPNPDNSQFFYLTDLHSNTIDVYRRVFDEIDTEQSRWLHYQHISSLQLTNQAGEESWLQGFTGLAIRQGTNNQLVLVAQSNNQVITLINIAAPVFDQDRYQFFISKATVESGVNTIVGHVKIENPNSVTPLYITLDDNTPFSLNGSELTFNSRALDNSNINQTAPWIFNISANNEFNQESTAPVSVEFNQQSQHLDFLWLLPLPIAGVVGIGIAGVVKCFYSYFKHSPRPEDLEKNDKSDNQDEIDTLDEESHQDAPKPKPQVCTIEVSGSVETVVKTLDSEKATTLDTSVLLEQHSLPGGVTISVPVPDNDEQPTGKQPDSVPVVVATDTPHWIDSDKLPANTETPETQVAQETQETASSGSSSLGSLESSASSQAHKRHRKRHGFIGKEYEEGYVEKQVEIFDRYEKENAAAGEAAPTPSKR